MLIKIDFWLYKLFGVWTQIFCPLTINNLPLLSNLFRTCKKLFNCHRCLVINTDGQCSPDKFQYKVRGKDINGTRLVHCDGKFLNLFKKIIQHEFEFKVNFRFFFAFIWPHLILPNYINRPLTRQVGSRKF